MEEDEDGGRGGKKLLGDKRCSNKPTMKNMKQTEPDLLEEEERGGGKFLHIKTNTVMNRRQKKGKNK